MDHLKALSRTLFTRVWLLVTVLSLIDVLIWTLGTKYGLQQIYLIVLSVIVPLAASIPIAQSLTTMALQPLAAVRQAILHVSKESSNQPAPIIEKIRFGRELVSALALQVYDMASKSTQPSYVTAEANKTLGSTDNILNNMPLPVFTIGQHTELLYLNDTAIDYIGSTKELRQSLIGKNINDVLPLSFPSELTYEAWLMQQQKSVVKANNTWSRVRLVDVSGNPTKQFDMAASFSKGSAVESAIVFFDHTETYSADDTEISFVAMAVHELRTPLTIMRGYIEVFEDELGPTLKPELKDFMHKMNASAQQLTSFVSNILNVARVEENQLTLTLHKEDINEILTTAVEDLELRAQVHGKHIELQLAPDMPAVAADRISIHEVINNLVDNAIKYSGKIDKIIITTKLNRSGMIEVSVQDFGQGIPASIVPKLFDKFYRSHRSKGQIGGTGLGLYICKAIVGAHGGDIGVQTKEGEGSTFTFTLEVFDETKHATQGQDGIMRGAHGWIKNHSLYRG